MEDNQDTKKYAYDVENTHGVGSVYVEGVAAIKGKHDGRPKHVENVESVACKYAMKANNIKSRIMMVLKLNIW